MTAEVTGPVPATEVACYYGALQEDTACTGTAGATSRFTIPDITPGQGATIVVSWPRAAFGDLDVAPEVVGGDTEARLSFTGATGDLRALGLAGPYLVVDLGGGSTELVRGTTDVEAGRSVDVGCVRMTERHLHGDPPTPDEVAAATADVEAALDEAARHVDLARTRTLVGVAGSVTTGASRCGMSS